MTVVRDTKTVLPLSVRRPSCRPTRPWVGRLLGTLLSERGAGGDPFSILTDSQAMSHCHRDKQSCLACVVPRRWFVPNGAANESSYAGVSVPCWSSESLRQASWVKTYSPFRGLQPLWYILSFLFVAGTRSCASRSFASTFAGNSGFPTDFPVGRGKSALGAASSSSAVIRGQLWNC